MKNRLKIVSAALGALLFPFAAHAGATVLTHVSSAIGSSGGLGGAGNYWSDMVFPVYTTAQDGWGWAGGAGGVQGSRAITNTGGNATPANEVFHFDIGSAVDSLNASYGAGNWTVDNVTLSFNSSYATQNNSRFGVGSGTFDILWVENDNWRQSAGTPTDRQLNPIYASSQTDLDVWAGSSVLLGSETFTRASTTGYVALSYSLSKQQSFVQDILSASATGDKAISLYLMGTSDTLGMIIFTGGQAQALPTLSFDVIAAPVPEPESYALFLAGLGLMGTVVRRRLSA